MNELNIKDMVVEPYVKFHFMLQESINRQINEAKITNWRHDQVTQKRVPFIYLEFQRSNHFK